jgi:hypothetical protein
MNVLHSTAWQRANMDRSFSGMKCQSFMKMVVLRFFVIKIRDSDLKCLFRFFPRREHYKLWARRVPEALVSRPIRFSADFSHIPFSTIAKVGIGQECE